jgi:hypothetical protein
MIITQTDTETWFSQIEKHDHGATELSRFIAQLQTLGMPRKDQEMWRYAPLPALFEKITASRLGHVKEVATAEDMAMFQEIETNVFVPTTVLAPSSFQRLTLFSASPKKEGPLGAASPTPPSGIQRAAPFEENHPSMKLKFNFIEGWQQHHVVVNAEAGANATLQLNLAATSGAGHVLVHLNLAHTAKVHIDIIGQALNAPVMVTIRAVQGNNGHLNVVSYVQDSAWFMLDLGNAINGTGSDMTLNALSLVRQNQYAAVVTNIRHTIGESTSSQLVKAVLYDTATTEYNGAVYVAHDAQKTDSTQSNPNLVLSDTARALSRPQLRIYADDVKCAHGATMGQLDPEPLFYLASRGFSHQECISIVLAGFAEEVLDQMSDPVLQKSLLADAIQFLRA